MEMDDRPLPGPLNGIFIFQRRPDGELDRSVVLCSFCFKPFSYHRTTSSLKYHLNAKHSVEWRTIHLKHQIQAQHAAAAVRPRAEPEPEEAARTPWNRRRPSEWTKTIDCGVSPTAPHTVLVECKHENLGYDITPPEHDASQLHITEMETLDPGSIKASDSPHLSGLDPDPDLMELDQLKREKIKMQLKVLKLKEEYYTLQINKLKQ